MSNALKGRLGFKGEPGYSAYEVAVLNGFIGTEKDWLARLGTSSHFERDIQTYTSTNVGQTDFALPETYTSDSFLDVYVEGERLSTDEYTIDVSTREIKLTNGLEVVGTKVEVVIVTMSTNSLPIVETLDENSTNEEVLGAKSLYNILPVDVKNFGAVGDGVTDDTDAIQKALDTGRNVHFPSGTYKVTKNINISKCCVLSGTGEDTIIQSEADVCFTTSSKNIVIENMKLVGNDNNIAISVYQTKQIIRNVIIEHFAIGCINKNSDYMGAVKFIDMSFDYVSTCFQSSTLTNGAIFERIVAYHFDRILKAYWIESISFNNCFFEKGNEGSIVLDVIDTKTNCRCMGLLFNSCYIENVAQLLSKLVTGIIKFDSCWLFTKGTYYDAPDGTNSLKLLFINCAFGISSSLSTSAVLFNFSNDHTAIFEQTYGLKNEAGAFTLTKGTNVVGKNVIFDNKIIKHTMVTMTSNENGVITPGQLTTKHRILCVYGFVTDGSSNMCAVPYMSGDYWRIVCRNPLSNNLIVNKEIQLRITYIESTYLEIE